jgi:valacyclovir hydrolase
MGPTASAVAKAAPVRGMLMVGNPTSGAPMPHVEVPGLSLYTAQEGEGLPLLMLPGALGTGEGDFRTQLGWFAARGFSVIAPDPRGYGRSRPPQREFPLDFYRRDAADMLALMQALGHDRFDILGWSDGANTATIMAALAPSQVGKLAVFGGNAFLTSEEIAVFDKIRKIESWSPRAAEAMRLVYGSELDSLWEDYVGGLEKIFAAGGNIYQELLPMVVSPMLVLHGAKDPLVPAIHPEAIHRGVAGSHLHVFPEGKHNIHVRYADEFNALVLAFLTG